ncbi:response regulator transcription factor [Achromobacter sp. Marseille-Q4962]|uniref:response regulator transcription factor n=1 Tax=Achromobacter sp. Marseille-Q4962 TaxID=2942202 RepID=UPI002072C5D8|nr:response regulator transcription factor [Achromobacter sp. Marseille-Q4962]
MNVLAIEPDSRLGQLLAADLARHGHTARVASGAREALDAGPDFDLILLELDLPDADGFDVLAQLRGLTQTPIVALTRRASLADRVRGLSEGADDYLAKPYALPELLARMQAVSRRAGPPRAQARSLRVGSLMLDLLARKAVREGRRIDLTTREFSLLEQLMRAPGQVLSRKRLALRVWGGEFNPRTNAIDATMRRLRVKVDEPFERRLLHTIWGEGYVLEDRGGAGHPPRRRRARRKAAAASASSGRDSV